MRVLLVANDEDDVAMYTLGLEAEGIAITSVRTPEEGAFVAGIRRFDAIVLGVVSRDGQGWGGCEALRAHPATAALPLIALSASVRADRANRDRARETGCAAFAGKPCTPDQLASIVRRVIAGERYIEQVGVFTVERS